MKYSSMHVLYQSSWTKGRETLMILSVPLTILCRAFFSDILQLEYHVVIQFVKTLSTISL